LGIAAAQKEPHTVEALPLTSIWEQLAFFESTDLVREFHERRHDRELNLSKAQSIVSHVTQGREYFEASRQGGPLVQPLLQYYGSLSLARGAILFLNTNVTEEALVKSHGLQEVDWGRALRAEPPRIGEVRVQLGERGTFAQLFEATRNEERSAIRTDTAPSWYLGIDQRLYRSYLSKPFAGEDIALKALLARVPDLTAVYENTYAEPCTCYAADVVYHSRKLQVDVTIHAAGGSYDLPEVTVLRRRLGFQEHVQMQFNPCDHAEARLPHVSAVFRAPSINEVGRALPPIQDVGGRSYFIEPLASGLVLSPLLTSFAIAYVLGMVARYYPTSWLRLLSRQTGDRELPLLRATSSFVQSRLPELIWEYLEPDPPHSEGSN
jgi:hypothetical protein